MKIALIGLGTVGQAFYELLEAKNLADKVKYIVVKDPQKQRLKTGSQIGFDWTKPLSDPEITHVVELIDDADEAFKIAEAALSRGLHFISANKKMLAENLKQLLDWEQGFGGQLYFEASVAGAIPIIRTLKEYFEYEEVTGLEAILNGSTNFILESIAQGLDYKEALAQAQSLGFAESDPFLDVSGWDPTYKLSILIYLVSGTLIKPENIRRSGLETLDPQWSIGRDHKAKLIASWQTQGALKAKVGLKYLEKEHPLYHVAREENAILVHSQHGGSYLLQGKGAGAKPTAWAVYADLKQSLKFEAVLV